MKLDGVDMPVSIAPHRHGRGFRAEKIAKSFTFLNSQLDDAGCLFFGISFFDMF